MKRTTTIEYRDQSDNLIDHSKILDTEIPKVGQVVRPFRTLNGLVRWYVTRVLVFETDWHTIDNVEVMVADLSHRTDYDFDFIQGLYTPLASHNAQHM